MSMTGQKKNDSAGPSRVRPPQGKPEGKLPPRRAWLWFVVAIIVNYFLMRLLLPGAESSVTIPYTVFKDEVSKGNVQAIYARGDTIKGRFKAPVTYPPASTTSAPKGQAQGGNERRATPAPVPKTAQTFETTLPTFVDPGFEKFLIDHHVEISAKPIEE